MFINIKVQQDEMNFDIACDEHIKYRLTKLATPKTNGMVEVAILTIKITFLNRTNYYNKQEITINLQLSITMI